MKTLNKTLLALLATSAVSMGANAALYNTGTGQPYVGVKAGQMNVDAGKGIDTDNAVGYGVYGGYNFTPNWGAEVEYVTTSDTDYTDKSDNFKGEYKAQTVGAYGTYKYAFPNTNVYAKGKLGFAQTQLKVDGDKVDDNGVAGGVGLGYNLTPMVAVEAEYNKLPSVEDVDVDAITIGAHMKF